MMNNLMKFPSVLQSKIDKGDFLFPHNTVYVFDNIRAKRVIFLKDAFDKNRPISREAFRSYAEMKKNPARGYRDDDPKLFGTSLITDKQDIVNLFKLPKPNKAVAEGDIYQEGGPCLPGLFR